MGKDEGGVNGGESSADSELDRQPHRPDFKIMAKRPVKCSSTTPPKSTNICRRPRRNPFADLFHKRQEELEVTNDGERGMG